MDWIGYGYTNPIQPNQNRITNPIQIKNRSKLQKFGFEFDLIFYKQHGLDRISDLIFNIDPIQYKSHNIM